MTNLNREYRDKLLELYYALETVQTNCRIQRKAAKRN